MGAVRAATSLTTLGERADELAHETESLRRLPDELAAGLRELGLGRAMAPAEVGGGEHPVAEVVDVIERLAYHDGATAWCAMIAATTSLVGGYLPADWAEAVYGPLDAHTGGFAAPVGRGRISDDGLVVTGRWQWGSGTHHCTWIGGGTLVVDDAGEPAALPDGAVAPFVLFPADEVELHDTWHVAGLKGTGSVDYTVTEAVVPPGRWVQLGAPPVVDRPLYRFSFMGALAVGVAAVGLGLARRAADELIDLAGGKRPQGSSRTLAERPVVQAALAEAEAGRRAARLLLDRAVADATHLAAGAADLDEVSVRVDLRRAASHAMRVAADAVDTCYTAGGGAAVYDRSPLQRVFRDVHVATQHAMVAPRTMEVVGRADLGLPTDTSQL
ncbi:MAG: acyl-CoA dehydrogenase family protein [Acidimicrobiales bacterium]|nr:acyl-CoA dehydrogenase family protein [Acidimicrobiales bacterium]